MVLVLVNKVIFDNFLKMGKLILIFGIVMVLIIGKFLFLNWVFIIVFVFKDLIELKLNVVL